MQRIDRDIDTPRFRYTMGNFFNDNIGDVQEHYDDEEDYDEQERYENGNPIYQEDRDYDEEEYYDEE